MRHFNDDDEDEDDKRIVRDGERVHVPMWAMDGMQRAIAQDSLARGRHKVFEQSRMATDNRAAIVDAFGDGGLALHRPGARYAAPNPRTVDHAEQVRLQHLRAEAYEEYRRQTCDAWKSPGREIEVKTITGDARADAYAAADAAAADAWRGPPNSGKWPVGSEQ